MNDIDPQAILARVGVLSVASGKVAADVVSLINELSSVTDSFAVREGDKGPHAMLARVGDMAGAGGDVADEVGRLLKGMTALKERLATAETEIERLLLGDSTAWDRVREAAGLDKFGSPGDVIDEIQQLKAAVAKTTELKVRIGVLETELAQNKEWLANAHKSLHDPNAYFNRPEWCVPTLICSSHHADPGCPPTCSVRISAERRRYEWDVEHADEIAALIGERDTAVRRAEKAEAERTKLIQEIEPRVAALAAAMAADRAALEATGPVVERMDQARLERLERQVPALVTERNEAIKRAEKAEHRLAEARRPIHQVADGDDPDNRARTWVGQRGLGPLSKSGPRAMTDSDLRSLSSLLRRYARRVEEDAHIRLRSERDEAEGQAAGLAAQSERMRRALEHLRFLANAHQDGFSWRKVVTVVAGVLGPVDASEPSCTTRDVDERHRQAIEAWGQKHRLQHHGLRGPLIGTCEVCEQSGVSKDAVCPGKGPQGQDGPVFWSIQARAIDDVVRRAPGEDRLSAVQRICRERGTFHGQVKGLREAVDWYADRTNWTFVSADGSDALADKGERARQAVEAAMLPSEMRYGVYCIGVMAGDGWLTTPIPGEKRPTTKNAIEAWRGTKPEAAWHAAELTANRRPGQGRYEVRRLSGQDVPAPQASRAERAPGDES